jgi:hypothetical protein
MYFCLNDNITEITSSLKLKFDIALKDICDIKVL